FDFHPGTSSSPQQYPKDGKKNVRRSSRIYSTGAPECIVFLGILVEAGPSIAGATLQGDTCVVALVLFVNVALEMSLAFIHPPSLELRGYINIKAMRIRQLERKWFQEGLQAFEYRVAYTFGDDYDEFDFLGIRWMQDGCWGQDHPAADYIPWGGEPISIQHGV
ncbi:hypothetical protein PV325_009350, partial [Microctonus aethiopoides]